jgi:uncharacterized iron-regulated membrane protein
MKRRLQRARKVVFFLHLWVGVILGGWFVAMGLTGSVLAWKAEGITWELQRRSGVSVSGAPIPVDRAVEAMKAAYPKSGPMELYGVVPPNRSFPTFVFIQQDLKNVMNTKIVLVDPYTAKVTPSFRIRDTVVGFCEYLHYALLIGAKGTLANGVLSVFAALLLVSGIWLWWPPALRHLKARLVVKRGSSAHRFLYDLHNVLGIYLFPLLLLLSLTAIVMVVEGSFNQPIEKWADKLTHAPPEAPPPTVKPQGKPLSNERLYNLACAAAPGSEFTYLLFPMKPDAPFHGYFAQSDGKGLLPEGELFLDPYTGKVLRLDRDSASPLPHRLIGMNEALHYGVWGGAFSKLIYTVAGFLPLGLFITGVLKWVERGRGRARSQARRKSASEERQPEESLPVSEPVR